MALAVILAGVFAVPNAELARDFKQDKLFLANVISFVPSTAVLLLLAQFGSGAMAFAWSRVVGQFVAGCVFVIFARKIYRPGIARSALTLLFNFGLPLAIANFVNYILLNVDYALVGHLMGAAALGVYVLAFNVASWPASLCSGVLNSVSMPAFSRIKHDSELLRDAIARALRAVSLVVMPMSGVTIALAQPLVLVLYGAKWAESAKVLSVLSFYGAIFVICLLFANIISGLGRSKLILVIQLIWLAALVPAMVLGVRNDGVVGAAFAHIAVIFPIVLPSYLVALRKLSGIRMAVLAKAILPALLASSAAALVAKELSSLFVNPLAQLSVGLASGGLIYVLATAPQLVTLIGTRQASKLGATRIVNFYRTVGRLSGLPSGGQPKHAAKRSMQRGHRGLGLNWTVALGLTLLVALGFSVQRYFLAGLDNGATAGTSNRAGPATHHNADPRRKPTLTPKTTNSNAGPVRTLTPADATAFGPGGTEQGDNRNLADRAIDGNPNTSWHTDWYASAHFGGLSPGTGLLVDMGRRVMIAAVQITLGRAQGVDLQLRVGAKPTLEDLPAVAYAANTGGVVRMRPTVRAHGRYVLIWFTKLAPDTKGTFQASVYNLRLKGRS
jgi:PST family polysaccharide transporter